MDHYKIEHFGRSHVRHAFGSSALIRISCALMPGPLKLDAWINSISIARRSRGSSVKIGSMDQLDEMRCVRIPLGALGWSGASNTTMSDMRSLCTPAARSAAVMPVEW